MTPKPDRNRGTFPRAYRCNPPLAARSLLGLCLGAFVSSALAFQPVVPAQRAAHPKLPRAFVAEGLDVQPAQDATRNLLAATGRNGVSTFLQRAGGEWDVRWDRRNDRPNLIQGSGYALVPGRGNTLTNAQLGLAANASIDMAAVVTRLSDFIADNADLLGAKGMDFRLDQDASIAYGKDNSHWFVEFAQYQDGVRVVGANLFFRIAAGNIIQFGANEVAPVSIDTLPVSTREAALDLALQELAFPPGTAVETLIEPGELLLAPTLPADENAAQGFTGTPGKGYAHQLLWRYVFRVNGDVATYQMLVDAHSNRVVDVRDLNDYVNATVSGGIYPTTNTDPEIVVPMPFAAVTNGGAKITDALGIYDYSGSAATTALNGKYFQMKDDCGSISLSNSTDGNLALGTSSGTDCTTPGVGGAGNTHASRSGFYHLTNINRKAITFFPGNSWLQGKVVAEMNEDDVCNAFWDGTQLNFFKSGTYAGTFCSNTGEIAAVFLHEWGHGMDTNSGGAASDYGSGEAVGDTFAFLETKDACIGKNFTPGIPCDNCDATCTGVRDVKAFSTLGARTVSKPSTVTDDNGINCDQWACPYLRNGITPYQGPMGYEGHCESYIASSANWDLSQALVARYGANDGWSEMDRIWYGSLTPSKSAYQVTSGGKCNASAAVDGCGANNWYTVFLAADDDNGNLADGTPNGCRIYDAFAAHGIACGVRPVCSHDPPDFKLAVSPATQGVCAMPTATATYTVDVGQDLGFSNPVTLSATGLPAGVTASFNPSPVAPGSSSTMTVSVNGAAAGAQPLTVAGTAADSNGHTATAQLVITTAMAAAPSLTAPADGAGGQSTAPTLSWSAASGAASYTVEIATDSAFTNIVQTTAGLTATSYTANGLAPLTTYYWRVTAINSCGPSVSARRSFTTANLICSAPNVAIPDGSTTGVSNSITIADTSTLTGLKVAIKGTHTYVGDLQFSLTRGSTTVMMVDRPGIPGSTYGCSGDNFDITLDDSATTAVESQCNSTPPALSGPVKPNNPINTAFANQPFNGTWTLKALDRASGDTGKLAQWCLVPTTSGGADTYTIGGSVSGLAASGLKLSLNGGAQTLDVASGATNFTFANAVANGTQYNVQITAQPAGQSCTLSGNVGDVAGSDVTSIAVTCTTVPTYTIGGTISGLTASGLRLSLNSGAQTLDVASGATNFTFANAVADGTHYDVQITAQPAGQSCTLSGNVGNVTGSDVTSIAVTCANVPTYTIGGTISGLAASGLKLSLNSGVQTLDVASGATGFQFANAVADGTHYLVQVTAQPTGLTCAASNNSGNVAGAEVTNVSITCVPQTATYSVGGSIVGLSSSGMVVSLNDTQTIGVGAGVTAFTFPNKLPDGTAYTVKVKTQPGGLFCTVRNGEGTIAGANVGNVIVDCLDRIFANGFDGN